MLKNPNKVKNEIVAWIADWFQKNGNDCKAVVGISGGKDSSVVAALCVEALGKDRVLGVLMPQGEQKDIISSYQLVDFLRIDRTEINVWETVQAQCDAITDILSCITNRDKDEDVPIRLNTMAETNIPARIRMVTLYAVAACVNGRVANTSNKSEDWVGYATKFGDAAGDFSPLSDLTVTEVKQIGYALGLPETLIEKTPIDGLCGKTDEDNLGFTYAVLDCYIREGVCEDVEVKNKIDAMHKANLHKLQILPAFKLSEVVNNDG